MTIGEQLGLDYSIKQYGLEEMLEAVAQGKADIAVSCLSITQEREQILDFAHSFYETQGSDNQGFFAQNRGCPARSLTG